MLWVTALILFSHSFCALKIAEVKFKLYCLNIVYLGSTPRERNYPPLDVDSPISTSKFCARHRL